jgi:ABC-type bacteriocin/lantibiotic exporter with double-glycine peptidase domain
MIYLSKFINKYLDKFRVHDSEEQHVHYSVRSIIQWLWDEIKQNRTQIFLNTFIGVTIVLLDLLFVLCTKLTVDIATGQNKSFTFASAAIFLIATIAIQIAFSYASRWIRAILGVKAQNTMQRRLFAHVLMSKWSGMEKYHSGDVINRIEKDVSQIVSFATESIPSLITVIVQFTGAFIFLFLMDKTLACVIVVLMPCFLLISKMYVKKMRSLTHKIRQSDSKAQAIIQESLQNRTVIKALEQDDSLVSRLMLVQDKLSKQVREKTKFSSISATVLSIGFAAGYLFAFLWGAHQLQAGIITYGALIAFIQLVGQIQGPAKSLTQYIPIIISTFTASERLMELEEIPRENKHKKTVSLGKSIGIRIKNIDFHYSEEKHIIHALSYHFPPGSSTVIMGETGAGKTTLIRLMLGLISPESGELVLYNGSQEVPASAETRNNFSYVPQGNTLFSGSIRDNLFLGDPNATTEDMVRVLHLACADFVFELPEGIDTVCGEQGYGLSEGQAQRICIARAFLRPGSILLLDEATSALDADTELHVLQNIKSHFSDKTLVIVSHREAAADFCEQKLELKRLR